VNYKEVINEKTFMNLLWKLEAGKLEVNLLVPLFQFLINEGHVWNLQNFHARYAMELIEEGWCVFGKRSVRSAYGGYYPSRFEIEADEPGSLQYQRKRGYDLIRI
tara:strand:- start:674 stop:988 length:315 start_codon:yes stop_codon:yes gene_type:complete